IIDQNPYEEQDAEQQISNEEDENVEVDVAPVEEQSNESENTEEVVADGEEMQGLEGKIFKKIKKFVVKTRKINPAYVAVRNAFRALVALNFRGIASAVNGNPKRTQKVVERFEKMGGKKDLILKSIANGAKRKPLFGQSKKLKGLEGLGITTEALIATGGTVVAALMPVI
ncbi:MAG TPA: hypothetical protein DCS19_03430, partial [Flavobacterium sp.]|nr:hypothetical protein [Flavobacterium sp.]